MNWLPDMDLNHDKQIQSLLCYRYTIGQWRARRRIGLSTVPSSGYAAPVPRRQDNNPNEVAAGSPFESLSLGTCRSLAGLLELGFATAAVRLQGAPVFDPAPPRRPVSAGSETGAPDPS